MFPARAGWTASPVRRYFASAQSIDKKSRPARSAGTFCRLGGQSASPDARHVAHWVADSGDNAEGEFVIVNKKHASQEDVVWIDYGAAVSLHRVRATTPRNEGRAVDPQRSRCARPVHNCCHGLFSGIT